MKSAPPPPTPLPPHCSRCINLNEGYLGIVLKMNGLKFRVTRFARDNKLVSRADRFMIIDINHPQTTCFYPVKWCMEIPSRLGGVR